MDKLTECNLELAFDQWLFAEGEDKETMYSGTYNLLKACWVASYTKYSAKSDATINLIKNVPKGTQI